MLISFIFSILLLGVCACTGKKTPRIDVRDWGALGDSITLNTYAIQSAIDEVADFGGGIVVIREGNYVTGTLKLRSGVTLYVNEDARLLGSLDQADYSDEIATLTDGIGQQFGHALLYGADVTNVTITGGGTIDGRGFESYFSRKRGEKRPSILRFEQADSVLISNITLTNSAFWVQHYRNSVNIIVDSVTVFSHSNGNNDGIDIDGSSNVIIRNSSFDTGDDSIVLKSLSDKKVRNVLIENNRITGMKSAVKTGTESVGDFSDIVIRDLEIKGTRGINLYTVDGADLMNVKISNIRMDSSYGVLMMRLGERMSSFDGETNNRSPGRLEQITIEGIKATNVRRNNDFIAGLADHPVQAVSIQDLHIAYAEDAEIRVTNTEVPEQPTSYPKEGMFGDLPAYGLYIRYAEEVAINGVQLLYPLQWKPDPLIPLIKCEKSAQVTVNWLISSTDTLNAQVKGC